jgi:hypothetical protein
MNTIFTVDDPENYVDKIDLDELYERKQQHDINTTNSYNTILNRIHNRIKTTSRKQLNEHYCWFLIPEMMIGVPRYDVAHCITYVMDKLQDNGFRLRYTHPNLLFISWEHWVPGYVRSEIKKKTGVSIDGNGNLVGEKKDTNTSFFGNNTSSSGNSNNSNNRAITFKDEKEENDMLMFNTGDNINMSNKKPETRPITSYKPTGGLIYNNELIKSLQNNLNIN